MIDDYLARFETSLREIDERPIDAADKLVLYGSFFAASLKENKPPPCGALAAEAEAMPPSMRLRTKHFFGIHLK